MCSVSLFMIARCQSHSSVAFNVNIFPHQTQVDVCPPPVPILFSSCQVVNLHTSSMSSLNSQESSTDICKLTDKQQAEYHDAYREYISQMVQVERSGGGREKPVQPHPGQFLQAASSEDKGVGGQSRAHC